MDNQDLVKIATQLSKIEPISLNQIPDIDLYMDQILTFLDEKLVYFKRSEDEKLLTKTMINNYTKNNVLPPPVNKKYSKKHMILLILVYHMKSSLSIKDISIILNVVDEDDDIDIFNFYESFINIQKLDSSNIVDEMNRKNKMVNTLNPQSEKELKILTILSLIIEINSKKQIAQKMIDELL